MPTACGWMNQNDAVVNRHALRCCTCVAGRFTTEACDSYATAGWLRKRAVTWAVQTHMSNSHTHVRTGGTHFCKRLNQYARHAQIPTREHTYSFSRGTRIHVLSWKTNLCFLKAHVYTWNTHMCSPTTRICVQVNTHTRTRGTHTFAHANTHTHMHTRNTHTHTRMRTHRHTSLFLVLFKNIRTNIVLEHTHTRAYTWNTYVCMSGKQICVQLPHKKMCSLGKRRCGQLERTEDTQSFT